MRREAVKKRLVPTCALGPPLVSSRPWPILNDSTHWLARIGIGAARTRQSPSAAPFAVVRRMVAATVTVKLLDATLRAIQVCTRVFVWKPAWPDSVSNFFFYNQMCTRLHVLYTRL